VTVVRVPLIADKDKELLWSRCTGSMDRTDFDFNTE